MMNDDSIQETAKLPNSIRLSTVEKKTERKNGHDTFVPPKTDAKEEKNPTETEVLSKTPEYPHLKEKAKPINLKPISGLERRFNATQTSEAGSNECNYYPAPSE